MAKILIVDVETENEAYEQLGAVHELTFARSFAQAMLISRKNHFDLFVSDSSFLLSLDPDSIVKINASGHRRNPMAILVRDSMGFGALRKMGLAVSVYKMKDGHSRALEIEKMSALEQAISVDGCLPEAKRKLSSEQNKP